MRTTLLALVVLCGCDMGERPKGGSRADEIVRGELAKVKVPPTPPPPPVWKTEPRSDQDDLDAVARAVLVRYDGKHDTMPDNGLIDDKPLYVKADLGWPCPPGERGCVEDHSAFTATAMPSAKFLLRMRAELAAEAKRTNDNVHYISITDVEIKEAEATLTVGVTLVLPDGNGPMECCCSETQLWKKKAGHWVYVKTTGSWCS